MGGEGSAVKFKQRPGRPKQPIPVAPRWVPPPAATTPRAKQCRTVEFNLECRMPMGMVGNGKLHVGRYKHGSGSSKRIRPRNGRRYVVRPPDYYVPGSSWSSQNEALLPQYTICVQRTIIFGKFRNFCKCSGRAPNVPVSPHRESDWRECQAATRTAAHQKNGTRKMA